MYKDDMSPNSFPAGNIYNLVFTDTKNSDSKNSVDMGF